MNIQVFSITNAWLFHGDKFVCLCFFFLRALRDGLENVSAFSIKVG